MDLAPPAGLSAAEWQVIQHLRQTMATSVNFKFTVYGQGSDKRCILDIEPAPRIRLSTAMKVSLAVDD